MTNEGHLKKNYPGDCQTDVSTHGGRIEGAAWDEGKYMELKAAGPGFNPGSAFTILNNKKKKL